MKKVFFAAVTLLTLSGLNSCMKDCSNGNGGTYQAYNCNGQNGSGTNNGQNGPTNPSAQRGPCLFKIDISSLNMVGIAGQGQFYAVAPDFDQNCAPDADGFGNVDNNKVAVSGLYSFDGGYTSYSGVLTCDAGTVIAKKNEHDATGANAVVNAYISNTPYAYGVDPKMVKLSDNLCNKFNSGIYIKTMTGKKESVWKGDTFELGSAEKIRTEEFIKNFQHKP